MHAKKLLIIVLVLLSWNLSALAADDVLLPLPFENLSQRTEFEWIGESFAIIFADLLDVQGLAVTTPEERISTFEKLGVKPNDLLTRAAEIRVAEAAKANLLLTGNYEVSIDSKGNTVAITAWLIDVREGRKKPFNFSGPLSDLQTMQGLLAWSILYDRDPSLPYSQEQFKRKAKLIPARAYEFFVKGMQNPELKSREIFLKRAIREFNEAEPVGHYAYAIYQLGLTKLAARSYAEAINAFKDLIKDDPHYLESRFYLGLAQNAAGQTGDAAATFDQLSSSLSMVEFLNNAGALAISRGELPRAVTLLQRAAVSSQRDPEIRFNYGYALWKNRNFDAAATELKAALMLNPKDGEASYLLAKAYAALGRDAEAAGADQDARRNLTNYARWEVAPDKIPLLIRLKEDFNRQNFLALSRKQTSPNSPAPVQVRLAVEGLERARQYIADRNDSSAMGELQKVLANDPTLAEAHYLRGQILQRKGDQDAALTAYSAAVYWNPRLTPAHVSLGQLYLARGDRARALSHCRLALEIEPQNQDAASLKRQVEGTR